MISPEREFYSFEALADRWEVTEDLIEHYFKTGKLKKFKLEDLNSIAPTEERERISRLLQILNQFADEEVGELQLTNRFKAKREQDYWADYRESDTIFARLLEYYGLSIDSIRIVIPHDEVERFENEFRKDQTSNSDITAIIQPNTIIPFKAAKFIEDCLSKDMNPDEIAIALVEDHGTPKEKFYGTIGRRLGGYSEIVNVSDATWRKRGERFYNKAIERKTAKNVTLSHPLVTS